MTVTKDRLIELAIKAGALEEATITEDKNGSFVPGSLLYMFYYDELESFVELVIQELHNEVD